MKVVYDSLAGWCVRELSRIVHAYMLPNNVYNVVWTRHQLEQEHEQLLIACPHVQCMKTQ